ncbi:Phytanoyl-CoA dioxygenase (PhyH) [Actinopolymorpha cephalotaxi]|uniref:Ectoine hydroxylase-related dioxygenase (Phytanoyl-CoA dioxygenase family) n=1 Tax=Actinopolymorpha cephalotaxi TaxID=504797 RepID=A0A1I2LWB5_9ACTN|nr:phytanoyl-CoA dioxygenase family protein [Actinopolymorpha cephalotaxi]NYH81451.1 ectoine hydroxylase-related dioxygenase (phytanoyl-CoA dioxygenase family) [Actinopolymorpha cephalotaxi]SFF82779.1 Phytanoyl-CoA dioxygenase (PhyH) [Actinopolymorpha cephalotaxi]
MDMATALRDLAVTDETLSTKEKDQLDRDGFLPLPGILSSEQVAAFNTRLAELTAAEGEQAGLEVHQEEGADRLSDLINKDPMFDVCFTHPRVLAGMRHVLGEFKVFSLNSRASRPGKGLQGLHTDYGEPVRPGAYRVCNSIWLLDDFTADNGATRVVPGSHRWAKLPGQELADPKDAHPDQVQLLAPAGTVVIFNSHLWHGGTLNSSDRARRAMHMAFCTRDLAQQLDQKAYIRSTTYDRLSPAQRFLLDVAAEDVAARQAS